MKIRSTTFLLIIILVAAIALAVISLTFDLVISQNIVNPDSIWANILEDFGELPGILLILVGSYIYIGHYKRELTTKNSLVTIALTLGNSAIITYFTYAVIKGITHSSAFFVENRIVIIVLCFLVATILSFFLRAAKIEFKKKSILFAKTAIGMGFLGYILFVQPLKLFWGRVRFRDLDTMYQEFTPWYIPQGYTGNQSFPSGHAAMGWMLLALLVFVKDKPVGTRIIAIFMVMIWALLVSASRVYIGAHYLSDVFFASAIMITAYIVMRKFVLHEKEI